MIDPTPHPRRTRRLRLSATVAVALVVADQVTKTLAEDHLSRHDIHIVGTLWLSLVLNKGAAFGLGSGATPIVEAVVVVLVLGLLVIGSRRSLGAGRAEAVGLGLVLGGAIGNLTDRLVRHNGGAVIDFVDAARFGSHSWWPVFNLADAGIVVGAVLIGLGRARAESS